MATKDDFRKHGGFPLGKNSRGFVFASELWLNLKSSFLKSQAFDEIRPSSTAEITIVAG